MYERAHGNDKVDPIDIRGEVFLLTRNIRIEGEDVESWGAQFVTTDTFEFVLGAGVTHRTGITIMDNVEMFNCSQINTRKAALRFEKALAGYSEISNSVLHNGYGWGINVQSSANLRFENNILFTFRPVGVGMLDVTNVTMIGNAVSHIYERPSTGAQHYVDPAAGITICALMEDDVCTDVTLTDNLVAGAPWAGFIMMGHNCGDETKPTTNFRNNVAHSINFDNKKGGIGAIIYPDNKIAAHKSTCYGGSYFTAYKCAKQGVHGFFESKKVEYNYMTMFDNLLGAGPLIDTKKGENPKAEPPEYQTYAIEFKNSRFYGESVIPDCPQHPTTG